MEVARGDLVPAGWARGCPDDIVVFTKLLNGSGAMQDGMMQLVPMLLRGANQAPGKRLVLTRLSVLISIDLGNRAAIDNNRTF